MVEQTRGVAVGWPAEPGRDPDLWTTSGPGAPGCLKLWAVFGSLNTWDENVGKAEGAD